MSVVFVFESEKAVNTESRRLQVAAEYAASLVCFGKDRQKSICSTFTFLKFHIQSSGKNT